METKKCFECAKPLDGLPQLGNRKFCSPVCNKKNYYDKNARELDFSHLSTGTLGAASELIASTKLIIDGFEVYRALSPSSSCDLIAIKDGLIYDIEVRTGIRTGRGQVSCSKHNIRAKYLVVVVHNKDGTHDLICTPEFRTGYEKAKAVAAGLPGAKRSIPVETVSEDPTDGEPNGFVNDTETQKIADEIGF
jgi:hypothetical protein